MTNLLDIILGVIALGFFKKQALNSVEVVTEGADKIVNTLNKLGQDPEKK